MTIKEASRITWVPYCTMYEIWTGKTKKPKPGTVTKLMKLQGMAGLSVFVWALTTGDGKVYVKKLSVRDRIRSFFA